MQYFPTAEGYVNNTPVNGTNSYNYVFNYTDHLVNVRLSYKKNAQNVLEILEENNYYPFGLKHEGYNTDNKQQNYKYKYNGKELQDELGLNMYDYGARNYDPAIGRWMNIDLLGEISESESPFQYVHNNPIIFVDPTGLTGEAFETVYKDTKGNTLLDTNDGSNDIIVVPNSQLKKFKELIKNTSTSMSDSQEWNDNMKASFLGMKTVNQMNSLLDGFTTQWSRQNAINYLQNPTLGNALAMSYSEALSQWSDPQKLIAAASTAVLGFRPRAATIPIEVTEESIAKALKGSNMRTAQGAVSIPAVERYVRMLENGSVPPPIKVAGDIIVDGNHRYIAGRLVGTTPPTVPGSISASQANKVVPIQNTVATKVDWGNH
ncbi:RHS repeat-associated core domain-containing protein [Flavobacterium sp. F-65]|uniref:RHS repeat-associated core domain-containing protein n=1 Tax=Flavobacterium pisciphilum TaxID=2893755 RepID=A0ABS8MN16_9FLAO|nr:RHS repeat-associated core domain-containing protein [Flavobacterium sp. F-65]MCC9070164.1 RHS repeat-associated core domain-containing protein [Flavobacterium sp. F-65]